MEFKRLLNKVHDKVSHVHSPGNSLPPTRQRSKDKRHTTLTRWRDKFGDVPRPRFFSNNNKNNDNNSNTDNVYSSSPLPPIPTITLSSPTLLKRSQSTIAHPPAAMTPSTNRRLPPRQKPRPISYTPCQTQRLSVPHVVSHLRSPSICMNDEDDDAISFYKVPIQYSPSPSRQVTWYIPTRKTSLDGNTDSSIENDSITSMISTNMKSSMSSSSSSSLPALMTKNGSNGTSFPLARQDSAFLGNEIIQPHKESNNDTDDDDDDCLIHTNIDTITDHQKDNENRRSQFVILNVTNTMMMMREHQLELQMTRLRIDNQRLQQQMDDMISGTWSSTTQLLAENDQLELQIQQLQKQQRLVRSSIAGKGEIRWKDEQEVLRHTRAQLGLVEYLEGEPDIMAALNRFKKLLTISC